MVVTILANCFIYFRLSSDYNPKVMVTVCIQSWLTGLAQWKLTYHQPHNVTSALGKQRGGWKRTRYTHAHKLVWFFSGPYCKNTFILKYPRQQILYTTRELARVKTVKTRPTVYVDKNGFVINFMIIVCFCTIKFVCIHICTNSHEIRLGELSPEPLVAINNLAPRCC